MNADPGQLPYFLFLAGAEGMGHHMLRAILASALERSDFVDTDSFHHDLIYASCPRAFDAEGAIEERQRRLERFKERLAKEIESGGKYILETASYPFGKQRETLQRVDLFELQKLLEGRCQLRVLSIYRDPVAATYSALRRGFTSNALLQARIIESNLLYLSHHLDGLPEGSWRKLRYESVLADPPAAGKTIAEHWEIDPEIVRGGLGAIRAPHRTSDIPSETLDFLREFFDEARCAQWSNLLPE